jgi:uncharacterized MAPEG superfamily protein
MKKNMGSPDRIIRVALAIVFAALIFTHTVSGVLATILGILAVVFVVTSLLGFCPLYIPCKMSTCKTSATEKK